MSISLSVCGGVFVVVVISSSVFGGAAGMGNAVSTPSESDRAIRKKFLRGGSIPQVLRRHSARVVG